MKKKGACGRWPEPHANLLARETDPLDCHCCSQYIYVGGRNECLPCFCITTMMAVTRISTRYLYVFVHCTFWHPDRLRTCTTAPAAVAENARFRHQYSRGEAIRQHRQRADWNICALVVYALAMVAIADVVLLVRFRAVS